jgi:hypothetical protein
LAPIQQSLEELVVHAGRKNLVDFDNIILLIVFDPQVISDQQIRPPPIYLMNKITKLINFILLDYQIIYMVN